MTCAFCLVLSYRFLHLRWLFWGPQAVWRLSTTTHDKFRQPNFCFIALLCIEAFGSSPFCGRPVFSTCAENALAKRVSAKIMPTQKRARAKKRKTKIRTDTMADAQKLVLGDAPHAAAPHALFQNMPTKGSGGGQDSLGAASSHQSRRGQAEPGACWFKKAG